MIKNPKISIITVSYNSQSTIKHTIDSVSSQTYKNIEYILIDGASNDWTLDILDFKKDEIDNFVSEADAGIYDAMNKGIKAANGDIIGILNSDDFYYNQDVLSKIAKVFEETNCDCLYGDLVFVNKGDTRKIVRYWKSGKFEKNLMTKGWMLPHPTFFVKKEIYQKHGLYNTNLKSAADYEMILRLLHKEKIIVEYIPEILIKMRVGGESNASILNRLKGNNEDNIAWDLNGLKKPPFIRFIKPLRKISQFFRKPKL
jgi:glycosyltransferase involved in cell wall biosynthesis